ncbi:flavodoxin domain-containing protein [Leifsonia xyli]|uniref:flavodoxin domain-containing protein n=1 Tax=Leifsonia xyli TaxID=1575 RepID=UPI003D664B5E
MRVLVAYASKYGATEGIAERIGTVLRDHGVDAEVRRCDDLVEVAGFDAYIVGSATYEFTWRKAARRFIKRNADELAAHPVWLFASGPVGTEKVDDKGQDVLEAAAPKQFAEYAGLLHPRGTQVFRGAVDHEKLRGPDRVFAWMPAARDLLPQGDFREWPVIDAWATSVADELHATSRR